MAARGVCVAGLVLVLGQACALAPRPPPAPTRHSQLGLVIKAQTLANGLRVVVVRNPSATEAQVTMQYAVGSVDDGGHPGLAHLVEHLMFQQEVRGESLFTRLEDIASFFNATTSNDTTTYVARAPLAQMDTLLEIEAARLELRCRTVSDAVFTREREVVINEIRQRDQATEVYSAITSGLYPPGHAYRDPVGGSIESVGAITRDTACAFAEAHYAPGNAVLVLSGNLADADVERTLAKLATAVVARPGKAAAPIKKVELRPQHVEVEAPIDQDILVLAWPLPREAVLQAKVRAVASALPHLVDAQIKGLVVPIELGDTRAPMIGIAVLPADDETFSDAIAGTRRGVAGLAAAFRDGATPTVDNIVFDRIKQSAIYALYSLLDTNDSRDQRLAGYVHRGLDPAGALTSDLQALHELSPSEGAELAVRYLGAKLPTVVTLKASPGKKRGNSFRVRAPIHEMGQRRTLPDSRLARQPLPSIQPRPTAARTRVLPNGLTVVLMPTSGVPTFDARLVFGTGTADEPDAQRGVASLAAHTLTWDLHFLDDLIPFVRAGAMRNTDVGYDHTTFSVQGLDKNLDVVLAGLRRWVREGTYDDSAASFVRAQRQAAKHSIDDSVSTDAWRAALYGPAHPYVRAGLARHVNNAVTLGDAMQFRAARYTPGNATLVIVGSFDPALADRWVDYLFADWTGAATKRQSVPAATMPTSFAKIEDVAMVQMRIAIPTATADRARQLVAAAALSAIARDVRFRLGASYTFDAALSESRVASFFIIGGWVDASRASAAVRLVKDRIEQLRRDSTAAAGAFVVARAHALSELRSSAGSATALAARAERDIGLGRAAFSDAQTSTEVEKLTLDDMTETLAALELPRATILMSGPETEVNGAFAVLSRKPTYIAADVTPSDAVGPSVVAPAFVSPEQRVRRSDLVVSLTKQPPPQLTFSLQIGGTVASVAGDEAPSGALLTGYTLSGTVAYHVGSSSVGALFGVGVLDGELTDSTPPLSIRAIPIDVLALVHSVSGSRWLDGLVGVHFDQLNNGTTTWRSGLMYGARLGIDIHILRGHRVGVGLGWQSTFASAADYGALTLSLSYRSSK